MKRTVYHTVRSGINKKEILRKAPFLCKDKPKQLKEWLGTGYYFWETFIKLGIWWGEVRYKRFDKNYIVCKTIFDCPEEYLLDLVNDTEQLLDIQVIVDALRKKPEFDESEFTAQFLINLICKKAKVPYKAIRAYGQESSSSDEINQYKYFFNSKSYIHGCPEIQICVRDINVIKRPMQIAYCSEDYTNATWTV